MTYRTKTAIEVALISMWFAVTFVAAIKWLVTP